MWKIGRGEHDFHFFLDALNGFVLFVKRNLGFDSEIMKNESFVLYFTDVLFRKLKTCSILIDVYSY